MPDPLVSRLNLVAMACGAATVGAIGAFGASAETLGIPAAVLLGLCTDATVRPGSRVGYPVVSHGPRSGNRVALSFDDGPDPEVTPRVLDALAKYGTRATFFAIGKALQTHRKLAQDIVAAGHELGNHSFEHSRLQPFLLVDGQIREIERGARAIRALTRSAGEPLYRPPLGIKSPPLARAAFRKRLTMVAWSLHSLDSRMSDPERIARRVLARIRPGDIVLMHDGHDLPGRHRPAAARALPKILRGLRERGLVGVTVSELLDRSSRA
jgi:peptidoglycan/xylan/chitin deacetylase (PgdA/CDA1 family)